MPNRKGNALFILLALMMVCLSVAGLAINICYLELGRTELQITNDICARAACSTLARTGSTSEAAAAARSMAALNPVFGNELQIGDDHMRFGVATRFELEGDYTFSDSDTANPNSVMLRLEELGEHGIRLPFGNFSEVNEFRPMKESLVAQVELDLAIVLDCSSSMAWPIDAASMPERKNNTATALVPTARWVAAYAAVSELLTAFEQSAQRESVALCTFNSRANTESPLTQDYDSIRKSLAQHLGSFSGGTSNIGLGMAQGMAELSGNQARPWASRAILLVTDGLGNEGKNPMELAQLASNEFIVIHTLTVSNEGNYTLMSSVSDATDGDVLLLGSTLSDSFQDIITRLPIVTIK